jgi:hypothetical protein
MSLRFLSDIKLTNNRILETTSTATEAADISFDRNQIFAGMTSTNVQDAIIELYTILKFTTGLYVEGGNSTSIYDTSMVSDGNTSVIDPNTIILSGGAS